MPTRNYRFADEAKRKDTDNEAAVGNHTFSDWKSWGNEKQNGANPKKYVEKDDSCQPRSMLISVIASGGRGTYSDVLL